MCTWWDRCATVYNTRKVSLQSDDALLAQYSGHDIVSKGSQLVDVAKVEVCDLAVML